MFVSNVKCRVVMRCHDGHVHARNWQGPAAPAAVGVALAKLEAGTFANICPASGTGIRAAPLVETADTAAKAESGVTLGFAFAATLNLSLVFFVLPRVHQNLIDAISVGQSRSGIPPFAMHACILALSVPKSEYKC